MRCHASYAASAKYAAVKAQPAIVYRERERKTAMLLRDSAKPARQTISHNPSPKFMGSLYAFARAATRADAFGSAKNTGMFRTIRGASGIALAFALAACQGSSGTGGLSIPAPAYNAPAGPATATSASRQQVLDGAVTLSPERTEIPLPALDGFSVSIALGTPAPATEASPGPSASAASATGAAAAMATVAAAPSPTAPPTRAPSAAPSLAASARPLTVSASASPLAAAGKIVTKMTVYPDEAPSLPSPKPSGDVQTFTKRTAIVRGYLEPASDVTLYGLGAIRFTIPQAEQTAGRGFTVAVYVAGKKHHESLVTVDPEPTLVDGVVASTRASDPLVFKKATGYLIMLYGDELPPTPAPAGNYPTPGTNPFPTQTPGAQGQPGYPQQPGYAQPGVTATPLH